MGAVDGRVWDILVGTADGRVKFGGPYWWVHLMVGCGSYWWVQLMVG